MYKKLNLVMVILVTIIFTGCGGTSTNSEISNTSNNLGTNIRMERDKQYTIEKGDQIEKLSENPKLKIDSNLDTGVTTVTLLSGSAAIIRGIQQ